MREDGDRPDFFDQPSLLSLEVAKRGHILLFSPKGHPELAGKGMEHDWGLSKRHHRKHNACHTKTQMRRLLSSFETVTLAHALCKEDPHLPQRQTWFNVKRAVQDGVPVDGSEWLEGVGRRARCAGKPKPEPVSDAVLGAAEAEASDGQAVQAEAGREAGSGRMRHTPVPDKLACLK